MNHSSQSVKIKILLFVTLLMFRPGLARAQSTNSVWAEMASVQTVSPATPTSIDSVRHWQAPDGREIQLVVKSPQPLKPLTVTMGTVGPGADAGPALRAAVASAQSQKASILSIPKGTYYFPNLDSSGNGHVFLQNLSDLVIEGNGSTFVFKNNSHGIFLTTSRRVKFQDLNLQYSLHMVSLGTIQKNGNQNVLVIDSQYPVTAADGIGHIAEYDPSTRLFIPGGLRVYQPVQLQFAGNQTYTSSSFSDNNLVGRTFMVFHHYYGGNAFLIQDAPGPLQTEDITLNNVTVLSGPGMGIVAYGIKRGLNIENSQIMPAPKNLVSTEYDGMHIAVSGGDVEIVNNLITAQGDDGLNLNSPVHPVVSVSTDGKALTLGARSRFISVGDTLGFFNLNDSFLGSSTVLSTKSLGGQNYQITIGQAIPGLDTQSFARDTTFTDSRVAVIGNVIQNCQCHGILAQTPNALIQQNVIQNTADGGIELLTNTGAFQEGTGAINVAVKGNWLIATGYDNSLPIPWSAISAYGAITAGLTSTYVNHDIEVSGNNVSSPFEEGCITIASSQNVAVINNNCHWTNYGQPLNTPSIDILNSNTVTVLGNLRSGTTTGGITVHTSVSNATVQPSY
jgi:hypothetical protein